MPRLVPHWPFRGRTPATGSPQRVSDGEQSTSLTYAKTIVPEQHYSQRPSMVQAEETLPQTKMHDSEETHPEEGDDVVFGNSLEQAGGPRQ